MTRILIDRSRSVLTGDLVATFLEPVTVYRVMDGEEVCVSIASGVIEGGAFATEDERAFGASWAATSKEDVASWGASWSKVGRLGKDLFVAEAQAEGRVFFSLNKAEGFDPNGSERQEVEFDASLCNTGLGCSFLIDFADVTLYRVGRSGSIKPVSQEQLEKYVAKHPLPDVSLRPYGMGGKWSGGTILGKTVSVGQDDRDGLWKVLKRDESPLVLGAKTKNAAVDAALDQIERGLYAGPAIRLNYVPAGFDEVSVGQVWTQKGPRRNWDMPQSFTVVEVGASYVAGRHEERDSDYDWKLRIDAKTLMSSWTRLS